MSSWVSFMVLVLCFSFSIVASDARHRKQPHFSAVLVGTVYCDTCFHQQVSKSTHFIPGAKVAVECHGNNEKQRFREEVKTNEKGEFEAKLPVYFSKNVKKIKECSVILISSSSPYCAVAASATAQDIHFKSKKAGTHIFSAGFFTFKPELCNQKNFEKDFPPPLSDPPAPFLPPIGEGVLPPLPIPDLPVPPLVPPLPPLPEVPLPPITHQISSESEKLPDQKIFGFPPNPFQPPSIFPPPSLVPPLPFQPSPPSLFPPLPFQPPPPSLIPPLIPSPQPPSLFPPFPSFPPIPSLIPSPPPPPPPAFPIPLPPVPLIPGFPPVPPASTKHIP